MQSLKLSVLPEKYAVWRLSPEEPVPGPVLQGAGFLSITKTNKELSIVCREELVPEHSVTESGWRILKVAGPLDFSLTGILAGLGQPLARQGISIFALSTYNTDYLLVKEEKLDATIAVLKGEGHQFL
ncbi:amino acid-binding protein [Desulforamulus profundi]|uniref:Amino acid-binding protein n=1 Tax=Desulforamulus profundi TaxID=1383067 RepID=A0A2C6MJ23_9FIRM|nr:ACT domain-containing protein [Desulforamulus profundi]PHJ39824.1 amino acid-binding protein [Desulforamulus profundi]